MNETKKYEVQKDGVVKVTTDTEDRLRLPIQPKQVDIGYFKQKTVWFVDKDKMNTLKSFARNQLESGKAQIAQVEDQLSKLKNINTELLPPEIIEGAKKALKKGLSKKVKEEMKHLSSYIARLERKQQLATQLEYMNKQLKTIEEDLKKMDNPMVL